MFPKYNRLSFDLLEAKIDRNSSRYHSREKWKYQVEHNKSYI